MSDARDEELSDLALLERSAGGDRSAFDEIVRRRHASVYRLARLLVHTPADAGDVLQQTFLAAWQGAPGFRGEAAALLGVSVVAMKSRLHRAPGTGRAREERGVACDRANVKSPG